MIADFLHFLGQSNPVAVQTLSILFSSLLVVVVVPCWLIGRLVTPLVRKWKMAHPEGVVAFLDTLIVHFFTKGKERDNG